MNKPYGLSYIRTLPKFLVITGCCLFFACKTREKVPTDSKPADKLNTRLLIEKMKENEFHFDYLSAKFSSDIIIDTSKTSFSASMRIKKDSVIWISISPALGIEVARAIITKDSVKFLNRLNTTYFKGDYNYISRMLHSDLDFELLQSLLVGNSVAFEEDADKLRSSIDDNKYLLSTIRKRKLKKVMEKNKELKDPAQSIWTEPEIYKISRILINDFNTNRTFDARFSNFEKIDSLYFPDKITYDIRAEKNVAVTIEYSKVTINKPLTFPFSIPEKYDPIDYSKEK